MSLKDALITVLDYVERYNKYDEEKKVAEAASLLKNTLEL